MTTELLARKIEAYTIKSNGCWGWNGAPDSKGYSRLWFNGGMRLAHKAAYELVHGPVPSGLEMDHLCRNRACVRPDHLEAVTRRENILRGQSPAALNARKTHCPQGHAYDKANTYTYRAPKRLNRQCRQCTNAAGRRYWKRKGGL